MCHRAFTATFDRSDTGRRSVASLIGAALLISLMSPASAQEDRPPTDAARDIDPLQQPPTVDDALDSAGPPPRAAPPLGPRSGDERFADAGFVIASSAGTALLGALLGGLILNEYADSPQSLTGVLAVSGLAGFLAGPYIYDQSDGRGSLIGAYTGFGLGAAAGLGWLIKDPNPLSKIGAFALPVLGMGAGYALFDSAPSAGAPSAFVHPDEAGGLRLHVGWGGTF